MTPRRLGVEHEFYVSSRGRVVDFRSLIHRLRLGQPNLDPADPNSYRLRSGAAVTCDGAEAEIALPPITIRPGFTDELRRRAVIERTALAARLPEGHTIVGCSTHISVSVQDAFAKPISDLYARTFAPALMLLMDRRDSPGLLVRPRPGRLELGGEFVDGQRLAAAALFALGSVLACERALMIGSDPALPTPLNVRLQPALARFGWYVDRRAFGEDLYSAGRAAVIRARTGRQLTGQQILEVGWRVAGKALGQLVSADERLLVAGIVAGHRPLPSEVADVEEDPLQVLAGIDRSPYGAAARIRQRSVVEIAPVMLTWDVCVFLLLDRGRGRTAFATVPGPELGSFLRQVDSGRLDGTFAAFLRRSPAGSRASSPADVVRPRLFDELGPRLGLIAAEPGPDGRPVSPVALITQQAAA